MLANNTPGAAQFQSASLYVGDLKPEVNETRLFDLFNQVGPVASIRICRDAVTRMSLGYGYVNFHNVQDADRAIDTMNFQQIDGRPCRIMWSQRDPGLRKSGQGNIFIKNLATSLDNKDLYDLFSGFGTILSCKVVTDEHGNSKGYGYIHFETQEAANQAVEKLNGKSIDDKEVYVGPFVKRNDRSNAEDFTNLYVKQFPEAWDEDKLRNLFAEHGELASVSITRDEEGKSKRFGFVNFVEHESAESAITALNGKVFDGDIIKEGVVSSTIGDSTTTVEGEEGKTPAEIAAATASEEGVTVPEASTTPKLDENGQEIIVANADGDRPDGTWELYVSRFQKKQERSRELKMKADETRNERITKYQGMNLYVKNLDDHVTDEQFTETFAPFGTITSARIMRDPDNKVSRGFGFVCYSSPEEATRAVSELNGKLINGKPIVVTLHQRKDLRRAHLVAQYGARAGRGPGFLNQQPMYGGMPMYMNPQMRQQQPFPMMGMMGRPPRGGLPNAYRGAQNQGYPMNPSSGNTNMPWMQSPRNRMNPSQQPQRQGPGPGQRGLPGAGRGGPGAGGRGAGGMPQQQMNVRGPSGNNMKFTGQARNQPQMMMSMMGAPPNMVQQTMPPAVPMGGPSQMNKNVNDSGIDHNQLAQMDPAMQKNWIGERLYPQIARNHQELAGKITGMLLEMDNAELLNLLESKASLDGKIEEAINVLNQHSKAATGTEE